MYHSMLRWCIEGALRTFWPPLTEPPETKEEAAGIADAWLTVFQCANQSQRIGLLCDAWGAWGFTPWSTLQWEEALAEETQERQLSMALL